ncbi:MAG TPA: hypothetical protein VEX41_00120, partial [Candidatus Eisenbacteria bacterium]|nr:hypothetical protein [Candidatus Eisenbacteria bacterium]
EHRHEAIAFDWEGRIDGTPDGVITYEMDGVCHGTFQYSKIGLNVHHPLTIGRRFRAQTPTGELRGTLPDAIDPQRIVDGKLSGMFEPYASLAIEVADGLEATIALDGDVLEMQDHRNWIDGNFKSYATPLSLGFPFDSSDGQRIRQVLTIGFRGAVPAALPAAAATIALAADAGGPLPAIGFGQASHGRPLSARESALIRATTPSHLRVDLAVDDPAYRAALDAAVADARSIGAALELAVFANEASGEGLADLASQLRSTDVSVARVLVYLASGGFSSVLGFTPAAVVRLVREHLEPAVGPVAFAGGTNQNFSDINRDRPSDTAITAICFAVSPTIHAADDASIVENLVGVGEVVRMARSFPGGRPVSVSPITIATRFGPYPGGPPQAGDLPPSVDVRQASLLGAAWTVGMLKYAAEGGAASVTAYETTGWRGIVETDAGNSMPDRFASRPGDVLPLYHVFVDVGSWKAGRVVAAPSSEPLKVEALAVETPDGARHVLVANVAPEAMDVVVMGLADGPVRVRKLDATTGATAMS